MKCIIHFLAGLGDKEAVYVYAGHSVCDDDECLDAIGDTRYETVMAARRLEK